MVGLQLIARIRGHGFCAVLHATLGRRLGFAAYHMYSSPVAMYVAQSWPGISIVCTFRCYCLQTALCNTVGSSSVYDPFYCVPAACAPDDFHAVGCPGQNVPPVTCTADVCIACMPQVCHDRHAVEPAAHAAACGPHGRDRTAVELPARAPHHAPCLRFAQHACRDLVLRLLGQLQLAACFLLMFAL